MNSQRAQRLCGENEYQFAPLLGVVVDLAEPITLTETQKERRKK